MGQKPTYAALEKEIHHLTEQVEKYRQVEKQLRLSEDRYRRVFERSGAPLIIIEGDMTISMANPEFEKLTGYSKEEIQGNIKWTKFVCDRDLERMKQFHAARRAPNDSVPDEYECRVVDRYGQKKDIYIKVGMLPDSKQSIASFMDITERKLLERQLKEKETQLRKENQRLKSSIKERYRFGSIIGKSPLMQEVYERIILAAGSNENVIVYGESGTGKELVARAIHDISDRSSGPFVIVHCGAIPENLLESEFFGYKKGAFTGAVQDKEGYFDLAQNGTLFLDEIGEIGLSMQVKLLRVLEGHGFRPVGGRENNIPNIRIIAATHQDFGEKVKNGLVREDFYYRIHIIPVYMPPLRDRKDDLPLLIDHFLAGYQDQKTTVSVTGKMLAAMHQYEWPGNVRELRNTIHRYMTLGQFELMGVSYASGRQDPEAPLPGILTNNDLPLKSAVAGFEREYIQQVLEKNKWHRGRAASALGINRRTLFKKMNQYGIDGA